jgi:hypothetical protein
MGGQSDFKPAVLILIPEVEQILAFKPRGQSDYFSNLRLSG